MYNRILCWMVVWLPKRLKYLVAMDVCSYATSGEYSSTVVPELTFMEGIARYGEDHNL